MSNLILDYDNCFNKALVYLSFRPHTVFELSNKLRKRFDKNILEKTIQRLIELNYLNDELFANTFIEMNRERMSRLVIFQKLVKKGIERNTIELSLEHYLPENETISARNNLKKKSYDLGVKAEREKALSYLSRKGYKYNTIKKVLENSQEI